MSTGGDVTADDGCRRESLPAVPVRIGEEAASNARTGGSAWSGRTSGSGKGASGRLRNTGSFGTDGADREVVPRRALGSRLVSPGVNLQDVRQALYPCGFRSEFWPAEFIAPGQHHVDPGGFGPCRPATHRGPAASVGSGTVWPGNPHRTVCPNRRDFLSDTRIRAIAISGASRSTTSPRTGCRRRASSISTFRTGRTAARRRPSPGFCAQEISRVRGYHRSPESGKTDRSPGRRASSPARRRSPHVQRAVTAAIQRAQEEHGSWRPSWCRVASSGVRRGTLQEPRVR